MSQALPEKNQGESQLLTGLIWRFAILLLVAAALRSIYLVQTMSDPLLRDLLILDSRIYDEMASLIASGDLLAGNEVFHLGPLYPYVLALLRTLFGEGTLPIYAAQQLLGLGSIALTAWITHRCFGPRAALFSASLIALYGAMAMLELKVMASTLAVFLSLASLALLIEVRLSRWRWAALPAGLVLALTCLTRPITLLFVPVAALWLLWDGRWQRPVLRRFTSPRALASTLLIVGVAGALAPVTIRNYLVSGEFVLVSAQSGLTFYQANNPYALGLFTILPGFSGTPRDIRQQGRTQAEQALGRRDLTASEVSRYWMRQGLDYLLTHPLDATLLLGKKLHYWMTSNEFSTEYVLPVERQLVSSLWLMPIPFGVIVALAFLGVRATGLGRPEHVLLYGFVLVNLCSVLLFYFSSRYRLPAVPVLACLAGAGSVALLERLRGPRRALFVWAAPGVVLALYSLIAWSDYLRDQGAQQLYNYGQIYSYRGLHDAAIEKFRAAAGLYDNRWAFVLRLGREYEAQGDYEAALEQYERVQRAQPRSRVAAALASQARKKLEEAASTATAPSTQDP